MGSQHATSRRAVVCLAGGVLLPGCSALTGGDGGTPRPPALESEELRRAASRPVPARPPVVPVSVSTAHLDGVRSRARDRLAAFESAVDDVENGDRRAEMRALAARADRRLQESAAATAAARALAAARAARSDAVAALWWARAAVGEVTRDDALDARGPVRDRLAEFRERDWYVGPDVDATLVAASHVEDWTASCADALADAASVGAPTDARLVGRTAGRVETARALLDDASHLAARLREGESATRYGAAFADALDAVRGTLTETVGGTDPAYGSDPAAMFDHEIPATGAALVARAYRGAASHADATARRAEDGDAASALLHAMRTRRDHRVFESVRSAVAADGGAFPRLELAGRVDSATIAAADAVESVGSAGHPAVAATLARTLARDVDAAGDEVESVLDADAAPAAVYDAAVQLWAVAVFAEKGLDAQSAAVESVLDDVGTA